MSGVEGKVVLLTGASSGIGWEAALALSRSGARLAVVARRRDKLDELAAKIGPATDPLVLAADVGDTSRAEGLVRAVVERFGRLDILVNNAGVTAFRRFESQDQAEIEALMRVNYLGAAALTRAALPVMLSQGGGHVVNVASIAGLFGMPEMAAYSASKFALVGLTEALRREFYGRGIAFTSFCPGSVDTPMTAEVLSHPALRKASRPYSARAMAELLVEACASRPPELIRGEAPGFAIRLSALVPRLTDWLVHQGRRRLPSLAVENKGNP